MNPIQLMQFQVLPLQELSLSPRILRGLLCRLCSFFASMSLAHASSFNRRFQAYQWFKDQKPHALHRRGQATVVLYWSHASTRGNDEINKQAWACFIRCRCCAGLGIQTCMCVECLWMWEFQAKLRGRKRQKEIFVIQAGCVRPKCLQYEYE